VSNEEVEEVQPDVDDNVITNDIMIENDIDDDVDMANPFNIDSKLDDIDVELDEEEDQ
jgi:hypothetical protein